jgi:hypothetical protein
MLAAIFASVNSVIRTGEDRPRLVRMYRKAKNPALRP